MIPLTKEKATLLIPLYGKAMDYGKSLSILRDKKAYEIIGQMDYDFDALKIDEKTNLMMTLRAKLMDAIANAFKQAREAHRILVYEMTESEIRLNDKERRRFQ